MSDYRFTMSIRIRHPTIDPAEITRILGIEPQHMWRVGEPRRGTEGIEATGTYRESYWTGRLPQQPEHSSDPVGVESELLRTLAQLRRTFGFFEKLKLEGGVAELHVSIVAGEEFSLEFLPESLALLGRLGLTVTFEFRPQSTGLGAAASA